MILESSIDEHADTEASTKEWALVACSSWLSGQRFEIPHNANLEPIKVGRGKDCDIIFPGTHLSREHVAIFVQEQGLLVKDLNSANGTYINDQRVKQGFVRPGDTLRLDVYTFKVEGPEHFATSDAPVEIELDFVHGASADRFAVTRINQPVQRELADTATEDAENCLTPAKQWKTRPTSPGNRDEAVQNHSANLGLKLVASSLSVVVVALCAYLFFI